MSKYLREQHRDKLVYCLVLLSLGVYEAKPARAQSDQVANPPVSAPDIHDSSVHNATSGQQISPGMNVIRFNDWELSCRSSLSAVDEVGKLGNVEKDGKKNAEPTSSAAAKDCRLTQRLIAKDTGQTVFVTTILPNARAKKSGSYIGIVSVPLGGYLAPGIELSIDKAGPYKILFETCNQAGCHAGFPIAGPVLKAFQAGKTASFKIWTTKAKPAAVAVSLAGLPDALAALNKNAN